MGALPLDFLLVFRAISETSPISLMGYWRYPQIGGADRRYLGPYLAYLSYYT